MREVIEFKNGDFIPFETVFKKYNSRIYLFAHKIVDNWTDAEDITSIAFSKVWLNKDSLESEEHLVDFLFKIAKHKSVDFLRRRNSYNKMLVKALNTESYEYGIRLSTEVIDIIYSKIEELSDVRAKEIMPLYMFEAMKPSDISKETGYSINRVYQILDKGLRKLRISLQPIKHLIYE